MGIINSCISSSRPRSQNGFWILYVIHYAMPYITANSPNYIVYLISDSTNFFCQVSMIEHMEHRRTSKPSLPQRHSVKRCSLTTLQTIRSNKSHQRLICVIICYHYSKKPTCIHVVRRRLGNHPWAYGLINAMGVRSNQWLSRHRH
jgi:hypothetical protein